MALDREYFDSINTELAKSKYYDADKVKAVLEDICRQAQVLIEENLRLKAQLEEQTKSRTELMDASAQSVYNETVDRANACAASILKDAQRRHDMILRQSERQQDYAVKQVERCITRLRENQLKSVEMINLEWQSFLCGLENAGVPENGVPADLDEKLGAIEREMRMIEEE